jgi:AcrR family transcriptional regulator
MSSEQPIKRKRGRPVQDANEGLRQALLDQSAKLFREKGYGNTTVRDIAAATGIHAGSWFYHFKTKHDILAAVVELGLTRALEDIEAIGVDQLPPREALLRLIHQHLHTLLGPDQDYIPVMLYEWRSLDVDAKLRIVGLQDSYEAVWDKVIERLRASGEWSMPTRLDRLLMFGALNWCAKWYKPDAGESLESLAETALQFILRTP